MLLKVLLGVLCAVYRTPWGIGTDNRLRPYN